MKIILGAMLIATVLASCANPAVFDVSDLAVERLQLTSYPGGAKILTGTLVNHSELDLSVAQIQLTLFDSDNRAISSMSVVIHDVVSTDSVAFREAVDTELDITGARVKQILIP